MLTELARQHNAHKARLQRIAEAAARLNPNTDSEFSAALNEPSDQWAEYQITKHKPLWFSIVRHIKLARLRGPHIGEIQRATCEVFDISLRDLLSSCRKTYMTVPRQVSMYLAKELTTMSWNRIGRATGDRDHTTVMHAHDRIRLLLKTNKDLELRVAMIRERLQ